MTEYDLNLKATVEHNGGEFNVSTVSLQVPHGPDRNQHFETLVSGPKGGEEMRRYVDEEDAREGHQEVIEAIERGDYEREPVAWRLTIGE